jgi:poly(hydroxyalkanoate) depolymerase family esterase
VIRGWFKNPRQINSVRRLLEWLAVLGQYAVTVWQMLARTMLFLLQSLARRLRPLVMVLHGCNQDHVDMQTITRFDELADRYGFIVVYPFITGYRGVRLRNCWGWWRRVEISRGSGEVEDLWNIVNAVRRSYRIDPDRVHVTGLSSGAAMAVAMAIAHSGKIASCAAVAGVAYGESIWALGKYPRVRSCRDEPGHGQEKEPYAYLHCPFG